MLARLIALLDADLLFVDAIHRDAVDIEGTPAHYRDVVG